MESRRSGRSRKQIDYTKFGDPRSSASEDDFAEPTPPVKKSKTAKKRKANITDSPSYSPEKSKKRRLSREEKQFQRDLDLALKESSTHAGDGVDVSEVTAGDVTGVTETLVEPPANGNRLSTRAAPSDDGLSSDEEMTTGRRGKERVRKRAQRVSDESDFSFESDSESDVEEDSDSGEDSDFDASPPAKRKKASSAKGSSSKTSTSKRGTAIKSSSRGESRRGRGRGTGAGGASGAGRGRGRGQGKKIAPAVATAPAVGGRHAAMLAMPTSAPASRASVGDCQGYKPPTVVRPPKGSPSLQSPVPAARSPVLGPARSPGLSSSSGPGLGGVRIKGPGLHLRLGLSRNAKVKPLHASVRAH